LSATPTSAALPNSSTAHSSHGSTDATEISSTNNFISRTTPTKIHSTTANSPETSSNETPTAATNGLISTTLSEILTSNTVSNNSGTDTGYTKIPSESTSFSQPATPTVSTPSTREASSTISTTTRTLETSGN
jgi:hypothetical protein